MNGDLIPIGVSINFHPPLFVPSAVNAAITAAPAPAKAPAAAPAPAKAPAAAPAPAKAPAAAPAPAVMKMYHCPPAKENKQRGNEEPSLKKRRTISKQEIIDGGVDIATLLTTAAKMYKAEDETIRTLTTQLDLAFDKIEELQKLNETLTRELFQWRLLGDKPPAYVVLD